MINFKWEIIGLLSFGILNLVLMFVTNEVGFGVFSLISMFILVITLITIYILYK